ncbi:hypothetical protein LMG28727_01886 [Paraburkholderia kirstenboschensis]|uniref:BON domain-containing protein n=1 Tax=Paraburkholderia kirstenboschensis TaxID=1245436 RepID=UPI000AB98923|nr:BON domain-containing protein [Paraburkholderia kirstenboschensis]CAD6523487.1 hypothetical protein LMG28727_01886 [Paraburkholderia kirstenboschensis]
MKINPVFQSAVAAAIIATSMSAWSQTNGMASAPAGATGSSAMTASSATSPATGRKADRALRRKVYAAIAKHKEIDAGNISVIAKDGAVTLNGTVTDAAQISAVADIAKSVSGVASVTNKLVVKKPFGGM